MDFIDRLKIEQEELSVKLNSLSMFTISPSFQELDSMHKLLLLNQRAFMSAYNDVLIQRLKLFNS